MSQIPVVLQLTGTQIPKKLSSKDIENYFRANEFYFYSITGFVVNGLSCRFSAVGDVCRHSDLFIYLFIVAH